MWAGEQEGRDPGQERQMWHFGRREEWGRRKSLEMFPRVVTGEICDNGWWVRSSEGLQGLSGAKRIVLLVGVWMVPSVDLRQILSSEFKFIDVN